MKPTVAVLAKSQTVLERQFTVQGVVFFTAPVDGDILPGASVPEDRWAEMGEPNEITITIQPGDRLTKEV